MSKLIKCDCCNEIISFPNQYISLKIHRRFTSLVDQRVSKNIDKDIDLCIFCFHGFEMSNKWVFK